MSPVRSYLPDDTVRTLVALADGGWRGDESPWGRAVKNAGVGGRAEIGRDQHERAARESAVAEGRR